jgi:hypothetical protein
MTRRQMKASASQAEPATLPTYRVLSAIAAGANRIPLIVAATGLKTRTVNALIYSLEWQGRLVAADYTVQRGQQEFSILRYAADRSAGKLREHPNPMVKVRANERAALTERAQEAAQCNFKGLYAAFGARHPESPDRHHSLTGHPITRAPS